MNSIFAPRHTAFRTFARTIIAILFLTLFNSSPALGQHKRCLAGANHPWIAYGHDFGKNEWGHDGIITTGWTYQTFRDSQGFIDSRLTRTQAHTGTGALSITSDLAGQHPNRSGGEVHFDLVNHRVGGLSAALNLTNITARCWVLLPKGSAGDPNAPNGVQLFFKSKEKKENGDEVFHSAYSPWRDIEPAIEGQWVQFTANPSDPQNSINGNFKATEVVEIGIKVGTGGQSTASFSGNIYIDDLVLETPQSITFDFEKLEIEDDFINFQQSFGECPNGVVRVFVFTDGRASPEFAPNGEVSGLDEYFFQDFDSMLDVARQHKLLLIPVLLDFTWLDTAKNITGAQLGGRSDIISDPDKRQTFIDRALKPLIQRYCDNSQILAWEIINEPEWAMKEVEKDFEIGDPVAIKSMQKFVKLCAEAIHSCSSQKVTVGSARRAWLHYWKGLGLDLYQFHWYDKFENATPPDEFPWLPYSELGLDKPCIIGEVPTKTTNRSAQEFLEAASNAGYEGLLFWSYRADDSFTNFSVAGPALEAWCHNSGMLVMQATVAKKRFTVEGECLDSVEALVINQKLVDADRVSITPTKITVTGKPKKLGIKHGTNQLQLRLKSGTLTEPFEFNF
ncbi:MAG TPA: hypothetical protein VLR90_24615 [Blastocatellia bacterium]|nr:hypothetical protein [Blastocatellia bacterium]